MKPKPDHVAKREWRSCPVRGCEERISGTLLMCSRHWYSVAKDLRDRVWRLFRTARDSEEHKAACREAVRQANEKATERPAK